MYLVVVMVNLFLLNGILMEMGIENHCEDQNIQEEIDISQLTGVWYAVETISHLQLRTAEEKDYYEEEEVDVDICPDVNISDKPNMPLSPLHRNLKNYNQPYGPGYKNYQTQLPYTGQHRPTDQERYRQQLYYEKYLKRKYLSITWNEGLSTIVYAAYYTHPVGRWSIYNPTEDEFTPPTNSSVSIGNIQVLKAVGNHLVLIFCITEQEEKLYTVVLSRRRKLYKEDLSGVHNQLRRLKFDFVTRRRMCLSDNATQISVHFIFTLLSLIYTFIVVS